MANTLYEFYKGKLPSIQERAKIYEQQGLGSASSYTGSDSQNVALLGKLQGASSGATGPTGSTGPVNPTGASPVGPEQIKKSVMDWLSTQPDYKSLTPESQSEVVAYLDILGINDMDQMKNAIGAIMASKSVVDPYYKEIRNITIDTLQSALGAEAGDFASRQRDLTQRIQDIKDDLATGKARLTVDQQAELAKQARTYELQLENLTENVSSSGLDFSTKRAIAEGRLSTENQDIIESTKRTFQRKLEDLQILADRGDRDAMNQLADYQRIYGENVQKLGRTAELSLGSANLPTLEGYKPYGGLTGTLEPEQRSSILTGAKALFDFGSLNLKNPFI
jgi:hypothetical protein